MFVDASPEVVLIAVIVANVFGFVKVPFCNIEPPVKLAAAQSNATLGFVTETEIVWVAVHVFASLSNAEMFIEVDPPS